MPEHEYNTRNKKPDSQVTQPDALSSLENRLLAEFKEIKDELINMKNVIITRLQEDNKMLKEKVNMLESKVSDLETNCNSLEQYGRRNNLELSGIPDSVEDKDLEKTVIKIFEKIDVTVNDNDIEACHRVGKSKDGVPKKTIVRFCNRKNSKRALYNRKRLSPSSMDSIGLGKTRIFISENLTNYNNMLAYRCRKLKRANIIHNTYTRDGVVTIVFSENGKPKKILNKQTLHDLFPDFDFCEEIIE